MELINPDLEARLRQRRVDVQVQDSDTVVLRNVPADKRCFNKPATNVLLARPQEGMPFLVCVDADLEYVGADRFLVRAFAGAQRKQGWRVLNLAYDKCRDLHQALQFALGALGFDLRGTGLGPAPPNIRWADPGGILARFGSDMTRRVQDPDAEPTVGREREAERTMASVCGWQARLPLIEGESGAGKTNLLYAVARKLARQRPGSRLIAVNLGVLMAGTLCESERENILSALFHEAAGGSDNLVLALEHLEMAFQCNPRGALLVEQALDDGLRLIGTGTPQSLPRSAVSLLYRRIDLVRLEELDAEATAEILGHMLERIAGFHRVRIDPAIIKAAVQRSISLAGCLPSKAISLLDCAAARAALLGTGEAELLHVYLAADDFPAAEIES